jgi:hypothetical protein
MVEGVGAYKGFFGVALEVRLMRGDTLKKLVPNGTSCCGSISCISGIPISAKKKGI